ncbi:glycoside hydrolase family 6 protein [Plantactinospora sp. KLBMP9567]|uniref:glycoside hydrolase family 6 protein n=1 Tax=Plantactinospora sp. KLBMP9567 TaxID=3085900 RepID=UPI00298289A5|nr:glycoside hydrolase family 6 protein [Plantactinospora sp. KLBMP9567]MDW5323267.1 glycoside hydrolase family 6 protein [Plantactinospora sp. KLBMP9567]
MTMPRSGRVPARGRTALAALAVPVLLAGALGSAGPAGAADPPHRVANPYAGARVYVNPEWSARAAAEPGGGAVADQPTAIWLDRIAAIEGTDGAMGLRDHLDAAVAQRADLVQVTLYNLPSRDCGRPTPQGELSIDELDRYRTEFIDPIVEILAAPRYAGLRIVAFVEPNSLPNLVVNTSPRHTATWACDEVRARGTYPDGIGYALARLGALPHVYPYLDISHHGELGWPDNSGPVAALLRQAATTAGSTLANVHGFVANTANYSVLHEEYFRADTVVNGQPVHQSRWVDWNPFVDEVPYARHMRDLLVEEGFAAQASLLVDTSRNGWGGPDRPTGPAATTGDLNEYVDRSRIDRRAYITNWCNQAGSGLGERPAVAPEPGIDAYVWVKPPGESDGADVDRAWGQPYEPMCDPTYNPWPGGSVRSTGALPDAPPFRQWFPAHFRQLLANAWPPL